MAKNNKSGCGCMCGHGMHGFMIGFALLLAAGLRYMGYSYREIIVVLGILAVLKGLYIHFKK